MKSKIKYTQAFINMLCLLLVIPAFSQTNLDSALAEIRKRNDTAKFKGMSKLFEHYVYSEPEKALKVAKEYIKITEHSNNLSNRANALHCLGHYHYTQSNYSKALDLWLKALALREKAGDKTGIALSVGNIGIIYYSLNDYHKALNYYSRAIAILSKLNDKQGMARNLGNSGNAYEALGKHNMALSCFFKSKKINEELGDREGITNALGSIGGVYQAMHKFDEAIIYLKQALLLTQQDQTKAAEAIWLGNIGAVYLNMNKLDQSETYLLKAIHISEKIGDLYGVMDVSYNLSVLYKFKHDYKQSLEYYTQFVTYKDSIVNEENIRSQTKAEMNFEFDKKEAVAKAEQEKKQAVVEADKRKQQILLLSIGIILLMAIAFSVYVWRNLKVTQKQKEIIESQKIVVETKQKEVIDSILYAKRIQQSLMPSISNIEKNLSRLKTKNQV